MEVNQLNDSIGGEKDNKVYTTNKHVSFQDLFFTRVFKCYGVFKCKYGRVKESRQTRFSLCLSNTWIH